MAAATTNGAEDVQKAVETAILKLPELEHTLQIFRGKLGSELFLDVRDLYAKTGYFTFDPGFTCTGSCLSAITFIDGPNGICLYRGYPVQDLCEKASPLEVAFLLLVGRLPNVFELMKFKSEVIHHMLVHEKVKGLFATFTLRAHPMAIMISVVGGLSCIYSELDGSNPAHRWLAAMRVIAQMPVLAAMAYKTHIGEPILYPQSKYTFAENFLYLMFGTPYEEYEVNPVAAKAIEAFMILHMDHEQNASTSTVRIAGSSQANPYACIASGVASLWGPAHGGANEAVIKMLEKIGSAENVAQFVADVKAKKDGVRLMGFGHRVYKNYDPRSRVMKGLVDQLLDDLGVDDPLLPIAKELERVALSDEYFVKRKLYPNVDFYSGIMLRAIGIPASMFTVMFAMSRTVGWISHWSEMVSEQQMKIFRPRQLYAGPQMRHYERAERLVENTSPNASPAAKPAEPFSKTMAKLADASKATLEAARQQVDSKTVAEENATLVLPDGTEHKMKILKGALGTDKFLDIRDLSAKTNCFTFDPGFTSTGSCISSITFIDGPKGICLYRGYPVQDLCERATPLEVAYLLLVGELPDDDLLAVFRKEVKRHLLVHEKIKSMYANFTLNAHPMAIMISVVGGLSGVYSELDSSNAEHRWLACMRVVAAMPVFAAMAYKTHIGQPIMYPRADLTFAENFLYLMFGTPMEEYKPDPVCTRAIEAFMILHMDHEQNASTSTVRIAGSSQANPYACIASGIASLWGPAHGGANEAVIKMLEKIGSVAGVEQFVADVKAKKDGVRLMGFGHRIYKNYDPRSKVMKELVDQLLGDLGVTDPLFPIAKELERVALSDEYFLKRKLYPNVDFYSGIMLRALGIPVSMFTVMFAMSRTVGWIAHWNEMQSEGQMRIGRPRQLYAGSEQRQYTPQEGGSERAPTPGSRSRASSCNSAQEFSADMAKREMTMKRQSTFQVAIPGVTTH
eukprot:TRINITY_DN871_c0_g1_i1.p1 TRINITY_DN871_c0_g1~~TRINITY_DN871_c0_g1_i1.p1  ORF type:complete len:964 (+),score=169.65 TRINITY_DN871_c0_g1_i1:92-2983(+)